MIKVNLSIIFVIIQFFSYQAFAENKIVFNESLWNNWVEEFRIEAIEKGISKNTLDLSLNDVRFIPRVIELDRRQPEFTMSFGEYIGRVVPKSRIIKGKKLLEDNKNILTKISNEFKVQPRFIIALWGIETDFGRITGGFNVIDSLATLAFEGRRAKYFRKELFNAIKIIDQGHIVKKNMSGSWAGAMGQPQFMPSSFLNFAIDYNRDGKMDIWDTKEDIFASIANYLQDVGWESSATWGREVLIPKNFNNKYLDSKIFKKIDYWQKQGVRKINGNNLPKRDLKGKIITNKLDGKAFLVYQNFDSILKWNRSNYFAIAVGQLSDKIKN
ncbi:lytic murein transglycosylase [Alphaproteobacteria bacterium]|nr:lytic murein transglycosylase [Alphaproteobacteria bacterium]